MILCKVFCLKTPSDKLICHWVHGEQGKSKMITPNWKQGLRFMQPSIAVCLVVGMCLCRRGIEGRGIFIRPTTVFCKLSQIDCLCRGTYSYSACIDYCYCCDDA